MPTTTARISSVVDDHGLYIGAISSGGLSNDTTLRLIGELSASLAPQETVRVYDGATFLGLASVTGRSWTFSTAPLAAGNHAFTVRVADAAGNQSPAGTPYVVTIDTSAPAVTAQVLSVIDDVGLIRGAVTRGGRTDDAQLQLTGSLSAALAPGESVQVFDGATWLGVASLTGSGLIWSFRTEWLSDASHAFTARVADAAGNLSASGTAFGVTVDSRAPTTLAHVSVAADNVGVIQGAVASGGVSDDTTLTLFGTISAGLVSGETVRLFDGDTLLGTANVDNASWSWSFTTPALSAGSHLLSARVVNALGQVGPAGRTYQVRVDPSSAGTTLTPVAGMQAASITVGADNVGLIQGAVASGGVSDDTTLTLAGTVSGALASGESVRIFDGAILLGTASVTSASWSWRFTTPALSSGSHVLSARVMAADGSLGPSGDSYRIEIDTTAPTTLASVQSVMDDAPLFTGAIPSGGLSNDTTPRLGGALSAPLKADETVRVYDGARFLGLASVDGSSWSFSSAPLAAGSHVFTARVADAAGNQSPAAAPYVVLIDSVPPTTTAQVTAVNDDLGLTRGSVPRSGRTDDPALQLSGSLSASLAPGESVRVYDGSTLLGVAQVVDRSWSLLTPTLANGSHSFTARVVDQAGNQSVSGTAYGVTVTPELRITALNPDQREGNSGSTPFRFQVDRSGNLGTTSSVAWRVIREGARSVDGADFVGGVEGGALPSGTLTFNPGEASKTLMLDIVADTVLEHDEGFAVVLSSPKAAAVATEKAQAMIRNEDVIPLYDWRSGRPVAGVPAVLLAKETLASPRSGEPSLSVTTLRIDLKAPGIRLVTTGKHPAWQSNLQETVTQTTRDFITGQRLANQPVLAAINTAFFSLTDASRSVPTNLLGLAVDRGQLISPVQAGYASFLLDSNAAQIRQLDPITGIDVSGLQVAASGDQIVLQSGVPQGENANQNARSALGLSADGRYLTMLTVDRSIRDLMARSFWGATYRDVGSLLARYGATTGLNLDGGGSTQMAAWNPGTGTAELINAPLLNVERFVGSNLGVVYQL